MSNTEIKQSEIDEIIRAYFAQRSEPQNEWEDAWYHRVVVNILKKYPEYSAFFLTSEEQQEE